MPRRAICLALLTVAACGTHPTVPFDSVEVPDAVRHASACAVNILAFSSESSLIAPARVPKVRAEIASSEAQGDLPAHQRRILEMLLDDIVSADEERDIGVHLIGAGFVADDPTLLWTCQHVIQFFAPKIGKPIEIVLFDADEQILFDSRNGRDRAIVEHLGSGGRAHMLMRGRDSLTTDFATIRLSRAPCREVGQFRSTPTPVGEDVFLPTLQIHGSPRRSHAAFVRGETVAPPGIRRRVLTRSVVFDESLGEFMLFTDAPGKHGLSGGPIFDAAGAIAGITTTMTEDLVSGLRIDVLQAAVK